MRLLHIMFLIGLMTMAAFFPSSAFAQAFGIREGTPISQLKVIENLGDNLYAIEVPQPNRNFESYVVFATPGAGVCKIRGIGKTLRSDKWGNEARQVVSDLMTVLTQRYGQPSNTFDYIRHGALWDEPSEWAASIRQNERVYEIFWVDLNIGNVSAIEITTKATSLTDTYVNLSYEFSNFERCKAYVTGRNNSGL